MPTTEGFVLVKDQKGQMVRIEDRKELEAFLTGYTTEQLANCIWDSIKEAFKVGTKIGRKQGQNPVAHDSGNRPYKHEY